MPVMDLSKCLDLKYVLLLLIIAAPMDSLMLRIRHRNGRIQRINVGERDSLRSLGRILKQNDNTVPSHHKLRWNSKIFNLSDETTAAMPVSSIPFSYGDILSVIGDDLLDPLQYNRQLRSPTTFPTPATKFGSLKDILREKNQAIDVLGAAGIAGKPVVVHDALSSILTTLAKDGGAAVLLGRQGTTASQALAACVIADTSDSRQRLVTASGWDLLLNMTKQLAADLRMEIIGCAVGAEKPIESGMTDLGYTPDTSTTSSRKWWSAADVLTALKLSSAATNATDFVVLRCVRLML